MNALAGIYSYIDTKKRQVKNMLADPMGAISAGVANFGEDQNKLLNTFQNAYPMPGQNSVMISPQVRAQAQREIADWGAENALGAATVWHGSPHKFDRFDFGPDKIGTGEGAQAYSHGGYLADLEDVAGEYQKRLTDDAFKYKGMNDAKARIQEKLAARFDAKDPAKAAKIRSQISTMEPGGYLYKVDLPDEHIAKMLDWDKPLSQQAPGVRDALEKAGVGDIWKKQIGHDISKSQPQADMVYKTIADSMGGQGAASEFMRKQGIPGVRYLDGGSRAGGAGSSNYVVFPGNEGMLNILERNGQKITPQERAAKIEKLLTRFK